MRMIYCCENYVTWAWLVVVLCLFVGDLTMEAEFVPLILTQVFLLREINLQHNLPISLL